MRDPTMLNPSIAYSVIDHAMGLGATFAELFVEHLKLHSSSILREVNTVSSGIDSGIGIRLFVGHRVLYGYTNSMDRNELVRIAKTLLAENQGESAQGAQAFSEVLVSERHPSEVSSLTSMPLSLKWNIFAKWIRLLVQRVKRSCNSLGRCFSRSGRSKSLTPMVFIPVTPQLSSYRCHSACPRWQ